MFVQHQETINRLKIGKFILQLIHEVRLSKHIFFFLCLLFTIQTTLAQNYFELGGGGGILHQPHIANAENQRIPLQIYAEYGWLRNNTSLSAIYDFNGRYELDNYEMNPSFIGLFINRRFYQWSNYTVNIHFFGSVGLLYESHKFHDRGNANVPGYVLEEEIKQGLGFGARLFAKVIVGKFTITPDAQFFRSNQQFIAGQFSEQTFQTGSNRLILSIGYRFNNGVSKTNCPTYY